MALSLLCEYNSSDEGSENENESLAHDKLTTPINLNICSAPDVVPTGTELCIKHVDPTATEIASNLKYEELFGPEVGPENPFKTQQQRAVKNMLSGYVEHAHISPFQFENQRRTFASYGNINVVTHILLHIKDSVDYQGRSFLHAPQDVGVNLRSESPPDRCFLPKAQIHTWEGHTKGISQIRWFPRTAHLLLSCSMDCRVKLWEVYKDRRCVRTYYGHRQAVRDISFDNDGKRFLSAAYDRYVKLWDTETGACISRFTNRKIPYCAKFNPDPDKQHLFVAGTSDKKIICWDIRSGEITQEYDRHLGAVNTITFVDENRRFVTTSDDKSLRVWEWYCFIIHKLFYFQKIFIIGVIFEKLLSPRRILSIALSIVIRMSDDPKSLYLVSGDADGRCYIWDWKTTKLYKKWKAHDGVCIDVLWHPHEPSKLVTAGWDGKIKYWD
ncbi:pre-mRNA-processing factor 17-like [Formica exsecta]|uniref:pre-mRNA-processing factor 17-like n=1 Tax=Formica exsecta TaxID=72781 RepID=UPI0011411397|nr:pre-mRNA-processing factor 17-like [Formica exsecta]